MGFSVSHLLVLLIIIVLLFGTGKLRSLGSDLGAAIKGFKKAASDDDAENEKHKNSETKSLPEQDTHKPG